MNRLAASPRFQKRAARMTVAVMAWSFASLSSAAPGLPAAAVQGGARSVWDGVYTGAQAERGRLLYLEHCATCHGASLDGGEYRALRGERFWIAWQDTTVDYLLGRVSATMPHSEDGSLKGTLGRHVYADIVAHMLQANGFPAGAAELTEASGAGVRIFRKDGSSGLPAGAFAHVVGCLAPRGPDRSWRLVRASPPVRIMDGREVAVDGPLGDREYALLFVLTPLDKFVGHRMSVRATLVGEAGANGLNVTAISSVRPTCE